MTEEAARAAAQAQQEREAVLVSSRIQELYESPINGAFDIGHLKSIHAYLFQDFPEHRPGVIRERRQEAWVKHRALEGQPGGYAVYYASHDIEARIILALAAFGDVDAVTAAGGNVVAARMAKLYGDLDYAHGFYEGNSRTPREFTRVLARALDTGSIGLRRASARSNVTSFLWPATSQFCSGPSPA